jgi:hypothetical protein
MLEAASPMSALISRAASALRCARAAHFGSDHREALALFARARRFHGGVQGEDVGLEGDALDDRDDVADLARAALDERHPLDRAVHDRRALARGRVGLRGELLGALARRGVLLDGAGDLLHPRSGLLERGGLLFGALRKAQVSLAHAARLRIDLLGVRADLRDRPRQVAAGILELIGEAPHEAAVAALRAVAQVPGAEAIDDRIEAAKAPGRHQVPAQDEIKRDPDAEADRHEDGHAGAGLGIDEDEREHHGERPRIAHCCQQEPLGRRDRPVHSHCGRYHAGDSSAAAQIRRRTPSHRR